MREAIKYGALSGEVTMARLTLEDVGALAGVSRSTVSRVINNEPNVRPEVKEKVESVIRSTGYVPNAAARSLVSNRTGVIGLVIPSHVSNLFEDPYFARLIQGVTLGAKRVSTTLSLFLFESEDEERELYPRVVESGFLDGVIVTATRAGNVLMNRIAQAKMPLVAIGRPGIEGIPYVDVDSRGGAFEAAKYLCSQGYERISFIGGPTDTSTGEDRYSGFVDGLAEWNVALPTRLRAFGDYSEPSGYEAMSQLIVHKPDAVFAASDGMALGAMRCLQDAGLSIPDDVAVIGFDGFSPGAASSPSLTTIQQPVAETGSRAVQMLHDLLTDLTSPPDSHLCPVKFLRRESA